MNIRHKYMKYKIEFINEEKTSTIEYCKENSMYKYIFI